MAIHASKVHVAVIVIAGSIADGDTPEELLASYPQLTADDIRAALEFANALR